MLGQLVFTAFPPTADALDEHGVPCVQVAFERAIDTGRPDTMPLQKYDISDETGGSVERFWSLISIPILAADGAVALVVQRAEDVTDFVHERGRGQADSALWQRRVEEVQADLFVRSQELVAAVQTQERTSRRLAGLANVALQLGGADTVQEMAVVLYTAGLPVLGANGGAIAVRLPDTDVLELTIAESMGSDAQRMYGQLPLGGTLPASVAARGDVVLVSDALNSRLVPGLSEALRDHGVRAYAALPLQVGDRLLGSLSVAWSEPHAFPPEEVELLRAFAAQCAQVLDRLQGRQAERAAAAEVARISETLQRSLLTEPRRSDQLLVAVRYQPASQVAQVGGDWYDAFPGPGQATTLVIGDIAGHDGDAAAIMAQIRSLLRGVAVTLDGSPAAVLTGLDETLDRLEVAVLATIVVAQISQSLDQRASATYTLRWSNAGHPPPVLLRADNTAELLARSPDLLSGLLTDHERTDHERTDHELTLQSGDTVLLYTDGLVETRRGDLGDDLERLRRQVARHRPADGPQALVDLLADALCLPEDDVALLAVQVR